MLFVDRVQNVWRGPGINIKHWLFRFSDLSLSNEPKGNSSLLKRVPFSICGKSLPQHADKEALLSVQVVSLQGQALPVPEGNCGSSASILKWKTSILAFHAALSRLAWCKLADSCGSPWVLREQQ